MDPLDEGGDTLRHLRRSDVVGVALVVAAAWISTITSHPRFYMVHNGRNTGVSTREWTVRVTAIAAAAAIRFYALGQTPLLVAIAAYIAVFAAITATRSAKEHPADFPHTLWWSIALILGLFTVLSACTTDQHITATIIRDRVTQRSILEHLLVCALATVSVLIWINESHYAFESSRSWTRHLRHVPLNPFSLCDEKASAARARAFAVLAGLMAACAVITEKCLAKILGTWDHAIADLASQSTLLLLATAWLVTTALECYWWHHAMLVDPAQAIPLLRPYLLTRMMVGVITGIFFFDDIQPNHKLVVVAGLTAISTALVNLKFRAQIEPSREDDGATPILLDAAESLLDIRCTPASPLAHRRDSDSATPPYRPPVHFRFA